MNYADLVSPKNIPQSEPLDSRQVQNHEGGFVYTVDKWKRLERFLILGSDAGTFYQKAQEITRENAKVVEECWLDDAQRTAGIISSISKEGRAPKNDPAIFALVLGTLSTDPKARAASFLCLEIVCRTGTHLLQFVSMAKQMGRGFGRAMKRAVGNWYTDKDIDKISYQVVKYRNRAGLTHHNVLDMARPKRASDEHRALFEWIVRGIKIEPGTKEITQWFIGETALPSIVIAHENAMLATSPDQLLRIIRANKSLPWEALPTWANNDPEIQGALLPGMGLTAIVRNLGNFTRIGLITPMSTAESLIVNRLSIEEEIERSRIHPMQVLVALKTYAAGKGTAFAGKVAPTWTPSQRIITALNEAFYKSFKNVVPTGKRHFIGLDVSASMSSPISGSHSLSCCEAASALALMVNRTEQNSFIGRFNNGIEPVNFGPTSRLDDVLKQTKQINGGGTDCSLPMQYATQNRIPVDVFIVLTDNETRHGKEHPMVALRDYRQRTGIPAKLIVVAMTATNFTIADPLDAGSLDIVGFDAGMPAVIADFVR